MKFMDGLHRTIDWYFATQPARDGERLPGGDADRAVSRVVRAC